MAVETKSPETFTVSLSFVALSPSPLVTHDYALSTADQVLLFARNSMTISVDLRPELQHLVHTVSPLTLRFTYG